MTSLFCEPLPLFHSTPHWNQSRKRPLRDPRLLGARLRAEPDSLLCQELPGDPTIGSGSRHAGVGRDSSVLVVSMGKVNKSSCSVLAPLTRDILPEGTPSNLHPLARALENCWLAAAFGYFIVTPFTSPLKKKKKYSKRLRIMFFILCEIPCGLLELIFKNWHLEIYILLRGNC